LLLLLFQVPSAANHFEQRRRVRNTWGNAPSTYNDKRVLFFLGKASNQSIEVEIVKENAKYGDIVQAGIVQIDKKNKTENPSSPYPRALY
jgi:hypothetical protein